ncbi:hypothetical protein [Pseudomonas sp. COR18]|uniref:hypothetical protein n=1 Tax=Pseudomonas sp. COR18 TaxID=3399680 RepID=UPI003AFFCFCD
MDMSPDQPAEKTCQILLKISVQARQRDGLLLELVGHIEGFAGAEILGFEFGRTGEPEPRPKAYLA